MRVLLADDQSQVRSALQILLNQEPDVSIVGETEDAGGLLVQVRAIHPDLILLDWGLPGLRTMGSLQALREICPTLLVIALSGRPEACDEALAAGADAFVSKVDPPEQLLATLRAVNLKRDDDIH